MATITIEEAQAQPTDLIHRLQPGEEIVKTEHHLPIGRLVPITSEPTKKTRPLGTMRGTVLSMTPDFDEPHRTCQLGGWHG